MNVGDLVIARKQGGIYIGELLLLEGPKAKVRTLAVVKHPTQGDLHRPGRADVAMFHERRALAHREVANVPAAELEPYDGEAAPPYEASLRAALEAELAAMNGLGTAFGQRAAAALQSLKRDYFGEA